MQSDTNLYAALLLTGFLGSLGHCLGMCGPLVMMVGVRFKAQEASALPNHFLYHGARISVYSLLGAIVGGVGSLLGLRSGLSSLAGAISLLLGLGIILFGLGYLGYLPLGRVEGAGLWLNRWMNRALKQGGTTGLIGLGLTNGLLPCGLVYSALLIAASSGGALTGALGMFLFGISTIPALLVVGVGAGALGVHTRQTLARVAGLLILVVGLQLTLRGLAGLGIISHQRSGEVMLW
jgi:sulfite exporter TauE/SafE